MTSRAEREYDGKGNLTGVRLYGKRGALLLTPQEAVDMYEALRWVQPHIPDPRYPDKVHWHLLTSEDIRLIRTLYSQQWTEDDPKEIAFPDSLVVVPREYFTDFMEFKKVPGRIGTKENK